jgi:hypothetical protein
MTREELMFCMVKFNQLKNKEPKKALAFVAPVMVASYKNELDETLAHVYETKIKPAISNLRNNEALEKYTAVNVVPSLANKMRALLEVNPVEGLKSVITREHFTKAFAVTA